jgi:hypothetical protein
VRNELSQIIALTPDQAIDLHERALEGNPVALRMFVLHSSWLKIKREKRYSQKARLSALRFLIKNLSVGIAGPEDVETAPESSLAPKEEGPVSLSDPRWGDTSGPRPGGY